MSVENVVPEEVVGGYVVFEVVAVFLDRVSILVTDKALVAFVLIQLVLLLSQRAKGCDDDTRNDVAE